MMMMMMIYSSYLSIHPSIHIYMYVCMYVSVCLSVCSCLSLLIDPPLPPKERVGPLKILCPFQLFHRPPPLYSDTVASCTHFWITLRRNLIYSLQFTTYNLQFTDYNVQFTTYNLQFTDYNVQFTIYNWVQSRILGP